MDLVGRCRFVLRIDGGTRSTVRDWQRRKRKSKKNRQEVASSRVHVEETFYGYVLQERRGGALVDIEGRVAGVLGPLSPLYIPVSNFALHPVVAVSDERPRLTPALGEVERILEVSLDELRHPDHLRQGWRWRQGQATRLSIPFRSRAGHAAGDVPLEQYPRPGAIGTGGRRATRQGRRPGGPAETDAC